LGNRVQHALHAYTPKEQKAVKVAAETFRPNPDFDTAEVISNLGIGQALVSTLDEKGVPQMVEQVDIVPPQSHIGAIEDDFRAQMIDISTLKGKYAQAIDRESAYEKLLTKIDENPNIESEVAPEVLEEVKTQAPPQPVEEVKTQPQQPAEEAPQQPGAVDVLGGILGTVLGGQTQSGGKRAKKSPTQKMVEKAATQAANTAAREVTKGIMRGLFGQMK
jgi:hypothetical protein